MSPRQPVPPPDGGGSWSIALQAMRREDFAGARRALSDVLAVEPENADAWALLSGVELALGDPAAAATAVERSLRLQPGAPLPLLKAGEYRLRVGDLEGAEAALLAALQAAPPDDGIARAAARELAIVRARRRQAITRRVLPLRLRRSIVPGRGALARRRLGRLVRQAARVTAFLRVRVVPGVGRASGRPSSSQEVSS